MHRFLIPILLVLTLATSRIQGGFVSSFDNPSFNIATIGGNAFVNVFVEQTAATTTLSDDGLSFAKFKLTYGTSTPAASVVLVSDVTFNAGFDDFATVTIESNGVTFDAASLASIFPTLANPNRILLGTFKFTAIAPGSVTLGISDFSEPDNFLSGLLDPLDSQVSFGSTTLVNVSAVPEPSAMALFSMAILGSSIFVRKSPRKGLRFTDTSH